MPGAGLAGGRDQVHACVQVQRGGVEHQVVQARILAVYAVGAADVADPGPVLALAGGAWQSRGRCPRSTSPASGVPRAGRPGRRAAPRARLAARPCRRARAPRPPDTAAFARNSSIRARRSRSCRSSRSTDPPTPPLTVAVRPRAEVSRSSLVRGCWSMSATACSGRPVCLATASGMARSRNGTPSRLATRGPTTLPPAPNRAASVTTGRCEPPGPVALSFFNSRPACANCSP